MTDVVKFFDNKQLVHIASEVVVLVGLTFYFSSKNKKMLTHIEELSQRIEDQEDHIQKLEQSIQQINQKFDSLVQQVNVGFNQVGQNISAMMRENNTLEKISISENDKKTTSKPTGIVRHKTPVVEEVKPSRMETKISFNNETSDNTVEEDVDEEELSDSDLDNEIRDELNELDSSLKKET